MREPVSGAALVARITEQEIPEGAVGVWWLGQSGLVLKGAGMTVYLDPYLEPAPRRRVPPAFPPEAVTNADLVLLTHDHGDHLDATALPPIAAASPGARFVTPRPIAERVAGLVGDAARVIPATADTPLTVGAATIVPVPARHEEFDLHPTLGYPYLGYVITLGGVTIYNAGDTIPYEGMIERLAPLGVHLAFLPINGRDFFRTRGGTLGNMHPREASDVAAAIGADTVVPVHYGMFAGNDASPGHFVDDLGARYPQMQAHIMGRFGCFLYHRPWRRGGKGSD